MYRLVQYHLFLTLASICLLHSTNTYKVGALAYTALIAVCQVMGPASLVPSMAAAMAKHPKPPFYSGNLMPPYGETMLACSIVLI